MILFCCSTETDLGYYHDAFDSSGMHQIPNCSLEITNIARSPICRLRVVKGMLAGVVAISTPTVAGHFRSKSHTGMTAISLEVVRISIGPILKLSCN